jgi:hypothetical protein
VLFAFCHGSSVTIDCEASRMTTTTSGAVAPAPSGASHSTKPRRRDNSNNNNKAINQSGPGMDCAPTSAAVATGTATGTAGATTPSGTTAPPTLDTDEGTLRAILAQHAPTVLAAHIVTATIYIPTATVGAVIGRKGQNIVALQKRAAAVQVSSAAKHRPHANSNPLPVRVAVVHADQKTVAALPSTVSPLDNSQPRLWTPVVVRADPVALGVVAAQIARDVASTTAPSQNTATIDEVVLDVPLHARWSYPDVLVGPDGTTLAQLSADTHVRIHVPPHHAPPRRMSDGTVVNHVVQLEGDWPNVHACLARMILLLATETDAAPTAGTDTGGVHTDRSLPSDHQYPYQATISVPLLPSQMKLRGLKRKHACRFHKKKRHDQGWDLTLLADSNSTMDAVRAVLEKWRDSVADTTGDHDEDAEDAVRSQTPSKRTHGRGGRGSRGRSNSGNAAPRTNLPNRGTHQ